MKLAFAGDTMLGRKVAERLAHVPPSALFADGVVAAIREADLFILNLECAISHRGEPWSDPDKPFFFRAPPIAVEVLRNLGVGCVTLANNHALDFGAVALLDTCGHLADAGIEWVGAGVDERAARTPAVFERGGLRVGVVGVTDHPSDYTATAHRPGVAYADLRHRTPDWLLDTVAHVDADVVVVSPHWGPNMVGAPVAHVRSAAAALLDAGATMVAGHSAHVFHGVADRVLYDLGDFIDDYARDPYLRNDLGLLWLVTFDGCVPTRVEAVPLALDYCHTRLAAGDEAAWITERFRRACAPLGTAVEEKAGRLVVDWPRDDDTRIPTPNPHRGHGEPDMKNAVDDNDLLHEGEPAPEGLEEDVTEADLEARVEPEEEGVEGEGEEEEEVLTPLEPEGAGTDGDEVEVSLDEILRQRLGGEEEDEEEEEEPEARAVARTDEEVRRRTAAEFVCQSCFLVKHRTQLADADRSLCRDCVDNMRT